MRDVFSHCQDAGAGGLVQVISILDLNGTITGEWVKVQLRRTIPSQPQKSLGKSHIPPINTAGGSAGEGEGVVGSHIRETSGVGNESDGYSWDCIVRANKNINLVILINVVITIKFSSCI